ncbi:MAG: putative TPR repeat methyltransferase [Halioglobus sp.]|jgi:predicted TPR repeat methyltransferase
MTSNEKSHLDLEAAFFGAVKEYREGNLSVAEEKYREILKSYPQFPQASNDLGCIYQQQGKYEKAVSCFEEAIKHHPSFVDAYVNLGNTCQNINRPEEAVNCYRKVLQIDPNCVAGFLNLGNALREMNQTEDALVCYNQVLKLDKDSAEGYFNVAATLLELERSAEALLSCQEALKRAPDNGMIKRLYNSLVNEHKDVDPEEYIRTVFNSNAESFESKLNALEYQAPQKLFEFIQKFLSKDSYDILDLGCGTGLSGKAFESMASSITGVDLSPRMLEKSQEKGVYQELIEGEVSEVMKKMEASSYDMIISTDVFIYIEDLTQVLWSSLRVLRSGGLMAFSIELTDNPKPELRVSGRWAQSLDYCRELIQALGFHEIGYQEIPLRKEGGKSLPGGLFVLEKN